ncbi:MAG: hypothetical protein AAGI69_03850 [Cyanobacteria bacterium P01_H01_bin.21]
MVGLTASSPAKLVFRPCIKPSLGNVPNRVQAHYLALFKGQLGLNFEGTITF